MDPLSVATSVAGLVRVTAMLVPSLYNLGSTIKEANKDAQAAAAEIAGMSIVLQGLQAYIIGRAHATPQRLCLISVEHITASLTACVLTYSELDKVLNALHVGSGLSAWDRTKWMIKRDSVQELVVRIQNHKSTFTCMLTILQCNSASEAEKSMDHLCDQVSILLSENKGLSARLRNLEQMPSHGSSRRLIASLTSGSIEHDHNSTSARSTTSIESRIVLSLPIEQQAHDPQDDTALNPGHIEPPRDSAFEEQLHRSRVYRHAQANHSESSLLDDGRSTLALSICSSLTLGEVSNISVFALPIFANELSNAAAYDFTRTTEVITLGGPEQKQPSAPDDAQRELVDTRRSISKYIRTRLSLGRSKLADRRIKPITAPGVFGVPLYTSIRYANVAISLRNEDGDSYIYGYVPIVMAKTTAYLKEKALGVENIFATGSSPLRIRKLQTVFDNSDQYGKGLDWGHYTVHDAANILLRYLLQLPEPVVPLEYYERFRSPLHDHQAAAIGADDDRRTQSLGAFDRETTIQTYQTLIAELPPLFRQLLLYLLDLLAVFASRCELNRMSSARLAAIFQSGILSHPDHAHSIADRQLSQIVLHFLVEQQDSFLVGMPGTAADSEAADEAQRGSVVPAQIVCSPVATGDDGSRSVISDPELPGTNTTQRPLSNTPGPSTYPQALNSSTESDDLNTESSDNARNKTRLDDTTDQSAETPSLANHLDWTPEQLPDIVL